MIPICHQYISNKKGSFPTYYRKKAKSYRKKPQTEKNSLWYAICEQILSENTDAVGKIFYLLVFKTALPK